MGENGLVRLFGIIILTTALWLGLAIPYAFVYVVPQPLQLWFVFVFAISTVLFAVDWLVSRRNG